MLITALTKFTALDFPGHLACIIFTGGCNLRCGFCHNPEFVIPERLKMLQTPVPFATVWNFLKARQGMLDGVVICGGEPTVQTDLLEKMKKIKKLGFAVKLDTNGTNPGVLEKVLEKGLVDYFAMDLKDAIPYRKELVGATIDPGLIKRSIKLIKESGISYEFRSTILPAFHNLEILHQMGKAIEGADKWVLQAFRNFRTLKEDFEGLDEFQNGQLEFLKKELGGYAKEMDMRV